MKTLTHRQEVYVPAWGKNYSCTVGSIEGYAAGNNSNVADALTRAIAQGHELAWTINTGKVICDSKEYYAAIALKRENATPLEAGEMVSIEGRTYSVKLVGKSYSDPIHFVGA